jgi:hypothetical protein
MLEYIEPGTLVCKRGKPQDHAIFLRYEFDPLRGKVAKLLPIKNIRAGAPKTKWIFASELLVVLGEAA